MGTPTTRATSASCRPFPRAREKKSSWSAGTTPRARPLRNTGTRSSSASARSARSPCPHHSPVPAMITGRSRAAQQGDGPLEVRTGRGRLGGRVVRRRLVLAAGRLHEDDVEREVHEGRAGVRLERGAQRVVDEPGDLRRRLRGDRRLRQGRDEGDVVDLLQGALAPAHGRRAAAEHDERRPVLLGRAERAHPVRDAGAGGEGGHAGLPRDLRPPLGGEGGGLLVPGVDEVDPLRPAPVVDREEVTAGQREELRDAVGLQAPRDEAAAVDLGGLLRLGPHVGDPTRLRPRRMGRAVRSPCCPSVPWCPSASSSSARGRSPSPPGRSSPSRRRSGCCTSRIAS